MESPITHSRALTAPAPADWRAEAAALARLAAPLVGSNLLQMAVFAVDVIFVSRLGPVDFAAATLGVFLYSLLTWNLLGLTTGAMPLIAAELGRRAHAVREVRRSFRMAQWLGLGACALYMAVLANGEALLRLAGQDAAVAARAGLFLHVLLWAMPLMVAAQTMRGTLAALGRPGWAVGVTALALCAGILGNWVLVFGHWGVPALGLIGSALASVVTAGLTALAYTSVVLMDRRARRFRLFGRWWRPEWRRLQEIARIGIPIALSFTMEGALFGGASILMGLIGVVAVDAHAVALNIAALAFQVPLGIAQAATVRVGMAYGARNRDWIARAGWVAIATGIGVMALTAMLLWLAPMLLVGIYLDVGDPANAVTVALAVKLLAVAALFQLLDGAQVVTAGALRGLQDTRWPMIIAGLGYWLGGFGTAVLLGFVAHWGAVGVWLGLAFGLAAVALPLLWRWSRRDRWGLVRFTAPIG
ncbi:MAG: MATE family efflux transporter [Sphingomonas sp.]